MESLLSLWYKCGAADLFKGEPRFLSRCRDWEAGGILPYPVGFSRLIAHGREHYELFRMTKEQRAYAVEQYFAQFVSRRGISRREYLHALSYFVFAETCEWVFVGNKHGREDCPYFSRYFRAAIKMARALERDESLF